jgi:hypothetical protein
LTLLFVTLACPSATGRAFLPKMPPQRVSSPASTVQLPRCQQAAGHLQLDGLRHRHISGKALFNPVRGGMRIFRLRQTSLFSSPRSRTIRVPAESISISCGQRCGLAYTSPSVPCISNALPPISSKNFPTRPTYSGCETLERRSAASSQTASPASPACARCYARPFASAYPAAFPAAGRAPYRDINRLMAIQLRLRLPGMTRWFDPQHSKMVSVSTRVGSSLTPCTTTGNPAYVTE